MAGNPETARSSFARINLEQARKRAKDLVVAHAAGDPRALDSIRWNHRRFRGQSDAEIKSGRFVLADAQQVIARGHHFESWAKLLEYVDTIERADPNVARFENAADAIVTGDIDTLRKMLDEHPELIQQRSTRSHRSTLLHYTSANGVEDYRQKTPANIVDITRLLLDRGAKVDAESEAYGGGSTTLGLTSTSAHPRARGVQNELIDLLVARGAKIDGEHTLDELVRGALANGCPEAANHLASLGQNVGTLYGAAAVGDIGRIRELFDAAGGRRRESALIVAAQMGQLEAVRFLLDSGVSVLANNGMAPMHYASANAHYPVMQLLLDRGANLEQLNEFGGAVLDSTVWFALHVRDEEFARRDYLRVLEWLIAHGARVDFYPELKGEIERVRERARKIAAVKSFTEPLT